MLNNLFSSFDVKNFLFFSFLFLNIIFILFFNLFKTYSKFMFLMKKMILFLYFNINKMIFFNLIFMMIFFLNIFSLNFFSFNLTSQFSLNLTFIFLLWLPTMIISLTKMNNIFLIHLLPLGTKGLLIPMMILIELMSFFIRPLTLFLRLSINMIAGHVLMSLISLMIMHNNLYYLFIMYIYMLMKFLVSFIQSYIIVTLINLYIEEIYD
uniref:ATP synthase subunit a n=1 Tax=Amphitetranychus viennensis TaxID=381746 RepID=A0A1L4AHP3_9ACAR|nr:ATP synthase F0 subunit 6 [Amphitetranychus viennensis]API67778.1 ATP synthase F0 subunit 6 [Amphitetranychus viennensis]